MVMHSWRHYLVSKWLLHLPACSSHGERQRCPKNSEWGHQLTGMSPCLWMLQTHFIIQMFYICRYFSDAMFFLLFFLLNFPLRRDYSYPAARERRWEERRQLSRWRRKWSKSKGIITLLQFFSDNSVLVGTCFYRCHQLQMEVKGRMANFTHGKVILCESHFWSCLCLCLLKSGMKKILFQVIIGNIKKFLSHLVRTSSPISAQFVKHGSH